MSISSTTTTETNFHEATAPKPTVTYDLVGKVELLTEAHRLGCGVQATHPVFGRGSVVRAEFERSDLNSGFVEVDFNSADGRVLKKIQIAFAELGLSRGAEGISTYESAILERCSILNGLVGHLISINNEQRVGLLASVEEVRKGHQIEILVERSKPNPNDSSRFVDRRLVPVEGVRAVWTYDVVNPDSGDLEVLTPEMVLAHNNKQLVEAVDFTSTKFENAKLGPLNKYHRTFVSLPTLAGVHVNPRESNRRRRTFSLKTNDTELKRFKNFR